MHVDSSHCSLDIANNLDCVRVDLVPVLRCNLVRREERRHETNGVGAVLEEIASVVKVDARRRVELQHRQRGRDRLDPHVAACDAGEDLLDGCTCLVGIVRLCRCLTAGNDYNVVHRAPRHDLGHEHRRNQELRAGIHCLLGVVNVHHCSTTNHHLAIVLGAEISNSVQAARCCKRELNDVEAAINRRLHGRWALLCLRCAEDSAGTVLSKGAEHLLEAVNRLRIGVLTHRVRGALEH
mmetsp:Transcript_7210/g.18820  ORF Transcript_7210/g.18820 Transcript_7210/m.18820 type:complete len:238 (-) Transcript_7210:83-796(-)